MKRPNALRAQFTSTNMVLKKKSLGQHFLHARAHVARIADAAAITPGDTVLEIGPGEGALTEALLQRGARVVAVEKDSRLISLLQEKFSDATFSVVEGDALLVTPASLGLGAGEYTLVGNIPYYITGALFKTFLSGEEQPRRLVFLIQKEVAERIVGHPSKGLRVNKKESILSLSVKAYGTPRYIATVPRGAFSPAPTVDSAILLVENVSRNNFHSRTHEEKFFTLVRSGFAQKRKLLRSNLAPILGEETVERMRRAGIEEKARAEDVPLEKWLALSAD